MLYSCTVVLIVPGSHKNIFILYFNSLIHKSCYSYRLFGYHCCSETSSTYISILSYRYRSINMYCPVLRNEIKTDMRRMTIETRLYIHNTYLSRCISYSRYSSFHLVINTKQNKFDIRSVFLLPLFLG